MPQPHGEVTVDGEVMDLDGEVTVDGEGVVLDGEVTVDGEVTGGGGRGR
jgi:phage baseplate assembly protein gpV